MWKLKWFKEKPGLERRFKEKPELKAQFLASPEVAELSKMSRSTVRRAIDVDPRLEKILEAAKNPAPQPKTKRDWSQYPEHVYLSSGGNVFHKAKNCAGLIEGQKKVRRRGGTPGLVRPVALKQAKNKGREPCLVCFPPNRKS